MIYLYKDLIKNNMSDYKIKKLLNDNKLYMINKGVYSTNSDYNYLEYLYKKHNNIVFTLTTACYIYGILNKNYLPYYVATKQKDRKINEENVKQIYMSDNLYNIGLNQVKYLGFNIKIYDLERLLIEVVRNKKNMDYDLYVEIINGYRKLSKLLNKKKLENYITFFKDEKIEYRINKEVF